MAQQHTGEHGDTAWRTARVVAAWLLLLGMALVVAFSYLLPEFRVCRDVVTQGGTILQVCGPSGTDDIVPLVLVGVLVFLLHPDLAGVTFGSFGLRKKVKDLESEVARLSLSQSVITSTASSQSVVVNLPDSIESTNEKTSQLANKPVEEQVVPPFAKRYVSDERARAEAQLIGLWNDVEGVLQNADAPQDPAMRSGYLRTLAAARDWRGLFRDEIAALRAVRNTVVHRPENLSDE